MEVSKILWKELEWRYGFLEWLKEGKQKAGLFAKEFILTVLGVDVILLMVQKSQTTTWDGAETLSIMGKNYQPQPVNAGFVNHQQYDQISFDIDDSQASLLPQKVSSHTDHLRASSTFILSTFAPVSTTCFDHVFLVWSSKFIGGITPVTHL